MWYLKKLDYVYFGHSYNTFESTLKVSSMEGVQNDIDNFRNKSSEDMKQCIEKKYYFLIYRVFLEQQTSVYIKNIALKSF